MASAEQTAAKIQQIIEQIETVIVGKRDTVEKTVIALLCNGHLLIEDIPGVGKTTLAKALALSLGTTFKRIQFTPDLLPTDITGSSIFNQKTQEFEFREGPVFAHIILADEINRASSKTQAALLEVMEELQVTSDGITHRMPRPFFVIATQNNVEHAGTYPLPEAQMDRFLMRVSIGYPSPEDEVQILSQQFESHPINSVESVITTPELLNLQEAVRKVTISPSLQRYIVDIVNATRNNNRILVGSSPRGSLALVHSTQAYAATRGRDYVLPDDIKALAPHVLSHRIILASEARAREIDAESLIRETLDQIPVPMTASRT